MPVSHEKREVVVHPLEPYLSAIITLFSKSLESGWAGAAAFMTVILTSTIIYFKVGKLSKKSIMIDDEKRRLESEAKNAVENKKAEDSHKKTEDEINDLIKGER